ncbi:hypothetical protein BAE44_0004414 [Dichanthelium oligosanthes]|uniref:DUF1618 domain-containing protein n=1 Tax=Dichanthelium oligosanthes TaxID=888268 RepID=A0A1E5WB06_9POAL|nr:hypothetical protein BAE44_0004414 [Dichanthelium oligosanthes]
MLRRGEEVFGLAYLDMLRDDKSAEAKLWVLRLTTMAGPNEAEKWGKNLPIRYKPHEFNVLFYWVTHAVVPFKNSMCWVNYYQGILHCDDVFGDNPKVSYHRLPLDSFSACYPSRQTHKEL